MVPCALDRISVGWWWLQPHERADTLLWWLSWGTDTQEAEQHLFCSCAECGRAETFTAVVLGGRSSPQQLWGWASQRDLTKVVMGSHCAEIALMYLLVQ